jgi:hypothetical protein
LGRMIQRFIPLWSSKDYASLCWSHWRVLMNQHQGTTRWKKHMDITEVMLATQFRSWWTFEVALRASGKNIEAGQDALSATLDTEVHIDIRWKGTWSE